MNKIGNYKIMQLMHFFFTKFNYKMVVIPEFADRELWMANPTNNTYPIIRITENSIEQVIYEKDRLDKTIAVISSKMHLSQNKFLDIHVGHDEILDSEVYDSIAIDIDYYDGIDVNYAFPGIKYAIHEVSDAQAEINYLLNDMNEIAHTAIKQQRQLKRPKMLVTYVVMALCIINFLATMFLQTKYDHVASMIVTGADYKMFTLGIGQIWRLITYAFVHGSLLHLLINMYSFYYLGSVMEEQLGSFKFALILFGSVVGAGLINGVFTDNAIVVGLSGGLYGLMAIYLLTAYKGGYLHSANLIQIIMINLMINMMAGVAIFTHLGGLITGVIAYLCLFDSPIQNHFAIVLLVGFFLVSSYRYFSQESIRPIYGGTDAEVIEIYRDLGLDGLASKFSEDLYGAYQK